MTFWRLALSLAFAAFACAAVAGSVVAGYLAPLVERRSRTAAPARRAAVLFRLRTAPAAFAAVWAFGVVLPTFLWFEPRGTSETTGRALTFAAMLGALLLSRVIWRIVRATYATHRLITAWLQRGRRLTDLAPGLDAFAIDEPYPLVAVAGVLRPRLFVAERVLRECTPEELRAMVAHETAHVTRRDNLRRLLVRVCADLPLDAVRLDADWCAATEEAADAAALAREPRLRVDLAGALVRVARLAASRELSASASAFYLGGSIDSRVRRIVEEEAFEEPRSYGCILAGAFGAVFIVSAIAAAPAVHLLVEAAVRLLP